MTTCVRGSLKRGSAEPGRGNMRNKRARATRQALRPPQLLPAEPSQITRTDLRNEPQDISQNQSGGLFGLPAPDFSINPDRNFVSHQATHRNSLLSTLDYSNAVPPASSSNICDFHSATDYDQSLLLEGDGERENAAEYDNLFPESQLYRLDSNTSSSHVISDDIVLIEGAGTHQRRSDGSLSFDFLPSRDFDALVDDFVHIGSEPNDVFESDPSYEDLTLVLEPERNQSRCGEAHSRHSARLPRDRSSESFVGSDDVAWNDDGTANDPSDGRDIEPVVSSRPGGRPIAPLRKPRTNSGSSSSSRQKRRPRGQFRNAEMREETSKTRALRACVRCRIQKVRCSIDDKDPSGVCITCKKLFKPTIHKQPCYRWILTDCVLYRVGSLGYTLRWPEFKMDEIREWSSDEIRCSVLKSNALPSFSFPIKYRKFVPIEGDQLERFWYENKDKKVVKIPPYAIASMAETAEEFRSAVDEMTFDCIEQVLGSADSLIRRTYDMAKQHLSAAPTPEERLLIQNVLRMWFMVNFSTGSCYLEGADTLDIAPVTDPNSNMLGKVLYPPVASAQLDIINALKIRQPLQRGILDGLNKLILSNKPQYWMTIYLCTFILLHNCSVLTADRYRHARKHAMKLRFSLPRSVEDLHAGANILLCHFHYYNDETDAFNINWKERHTTRLAHLGPREAGFLIHTSEVVKEKAEHFRMCKEYNLFEDELYFVSQLYENSWSPRDLFKSPI